ncbi:3-dehydro-L-gulonate 2-dehydrogenase [Bacteroidota bacterium]
MVYLSFDELKITLKSKLQDYGFTENDSELCSTIFVDNNLVGVSSHGTNRFPAFIDLIRAGFIDVKAKPSLINKFGAWEQWDGNKGPGPLNAWQITDSVIELAKSNGIGCITLRNTNHWMRAGTYGWKAAEANFILICWTNAYPLMPPWGSKEPRIGNNPITLAVPRINGPVVLDIAMSQYSYGKLANFRRENKELPYYGGYDSNGNLTKTAADIYETKRPLPIGYWKGSGLALLLDLITTLLSNGNSSLDLGKGKHDTAMSQVYIAFDPLKSQSIDNINKITDEIINSIKISQPAEGFSEVLYPGERALKLRKKYLSEGIPVNKSIWERILKL